MTIAEELVRVLKDAEQARTWGNIQIDLQDGKAVVIRQTTTRKLYGENNRDYYHSR